MGGNVHENQEPRDGDRRSYVGIESLHRLSCELGIAVERLVYSLGPECKAIAVSASDAGDTGQLRCLDLKLVAHLVVETA